MFFGQRTRIAIGFVGSVFLGVQLALTTFVEPIQAQLSTAPPPAQFGNSNLQPGAQGLVSAPSQQQTQPTPVPQQPSASAPPNTPPDQASPQKQGGPLIPGSAEAMRRATPPPQVPRVSEIETVSTYKTNGVSDVRAVLRTSMGDITLRLDRMRAPKTVAQFIALARGEREFTDVTTSKRVRRPFYNGLTFHRVVKGFLIQTGCPFGTGRGGPGEGNFVPDEFKTDMRFNRAGLVAMAQVREKDGTAIAKNSNGSQFFITLAPIPEWDRDGMTIIGEVEDGIDVVAKISAVKTGPTDRPIKRVILQAIDVVDSAAAGR